VREYEGDSINTPRNKKGLRPIENPVPGGMKGKTLVERKESFREGGKKKSVIPYPA